MIRFKATNGSHHVFDTVDSGFMKLRTRRFGSADDIEARLWDEITNSPDFKRRIRQLAEKLEAGQTVIGLTEFGKQEEDFAKHKEET